MKFKDNTEKINVNVNHVYSSTLALIPDRTSLEVSEEKKSLNGKKIIELNVESDCKEVHLTTLTDNITNTGIALTNTGNNVLEIKEDSPNPHHPKINFNCSLFTNNLVDDDDPCREGEASELTLC